MNAQKAIAVLILTLGWLGSSACAKNSGTYSDRAGSVDSKSTQGGDSKGGLQPTSNDELTLQAIQRTSYFRGATGFFVKDSETLRNTINTCLQTGLLTLKPEMITNPVNPAARTALSNEGRKTILQQNFNLDAAAKRDVIDVLAKDLYDPMKVSRVETAAGYLTLEYLGALATVADVVAWNCDFGAPSSRCDCSSEEKAKAILERCIPSYSTVQVFDAAKKFAAECSVADVAKKREILASFLASTTFAEAR